MYCYLQYKIIANTYIFYSIFSIRTVTKDQSFLRTKNKITSKNSLVTLLVIKNSSIVYLRIFAIFDKRTPFHYFANMAKVLLTDFLDLKAFQRLFPVILTDNCSEFMRVEDLENT